MDAVRRPPVLPWPDIGHLAKWSVSSFKFGFGPECLQDQDPDTFWQLSLTLSHSTSIHLCLLLKPDNRPFPFSSDGPQPHFITVEFPRKMAIQVRTPHHQRPLLSLLVQRTIRKKSESLLPFPLLTLRAYANNNDDDDDRNSASTSATSSTIPTHPPRSPYVPARVPATYKRCVRSRSTVQTAGSPLTSLRNPPTTAKDCASLPPPFPTSLCKNVINPTFNSKPIHAYILQVIILANHMNGKDTHVRGMRILGPVE